MDCPQSTRDLLMKSWRIPGLLSALAVYAFLVRYHDYHAHIDQAWGYLGILSDPLLIFDSAARLLATGTFMQPDGTYARLTGLAGYGLGTLAMAVGGFYPGYAWLRLWLIGIGALVPVIGFLVIWEALGSALAAFGVAVLLAAEPLLVAESRTIYHDMPATLMLGIALWLFYRLLKQNRVRPGLAAGLGAVSGLAVLAKMSHLGWLSVMAGTLVCGPRRIAARWKNLGIALVVAGLILGVWVARNAHVVGAPVLSTSVGASLAAGTKQSVWNPPGGLGGGETPVGQEQQYNRLYAAQAVAWIRQHPREYLEHLCGKFSAFWSRGPSPWWRALLWGSAASMVIAVWWERRAFVMMLPVLVSLVWYTVAVSIVWPPNPSYYVPFTFLLILLWAPAFVGTLDRAWRVVQRTAAARLMPKPWRVGVAVLMGIILGGVPMTTAWQAIHQDHRRVAADQAFLQWAGRVLPSEKVILVKTVLGNPWETQRLTRHPVIFNVLNGIPWFIYKTPYTWRDYRRDYQPGKSNPTEFQYDRQPDPGIAQAAAEAASTRQLLAAWHAHGYQLFVLDLDARPLAETFLPLNAYPLRGDEWALKFFQAYPEDPRRAIYQLVPHDDPRLAHFGPGTEEAVVWETAPMTNGQTTVSWTGAFGPEAGLAKLLVNGRYALSFALGPSGNRVWAEQGYRLEYIQRRPWWTSSPGPQYSVGTLALTVPAAMVTPGAPLRISMSPVIVTNTPESWCGLVNTPETGFAGLIGSSEVLRGVDDGPSGKVDIWVARNRVSVS